MLHSSPGGGKKERGAKVYSRWACMHAPGEQSMPANSCHLTASTVTSALERGNMHLRQRLWAGPCSRHLAAAEEHSWCSHWPGTSAGTPGRGRTRSRSDTRPREGTTPTHCIPVHSCKAITRLGTVLQTARCYQATSVTGHAPTSLAVVHEGKHHHKGARMQHDVGGDCRSMVSTCRLYRLKCCICGKA